jgi:hypothetical protein
VGELAREGGREGGRKEKKEGNITIEAKENFSRDSR